MLEGRMNNNELDEAAAAIRGRLASMAEEYTEQQKLIRTVRARLTRPQLEQWAIEELSMDIPTLRDMLAFNGMVEGITDNMTNWSTRSVTRNSDSYRQSENDPD